jgi:hypothetical protein
MRPPRPGERLGRWWTTTLPVTLVSKGAVGIPWAWWVEDAKGKLGWMDERDLVPVEAVPE